eukprot:CAMPEP_0117081284 /NCGR_PEP_ID=MMETSP0472-20121206/57301_1 /TAXON_ID=693140 ORGANISM="Tiarina fusus, Strain LIS" /NCGR_SAMPLE_ID=MMETSP0472 /ASSEMBLY_ACC=CAM_ASM_000603 /LENGTH=938 /DNA_ID=CAMNT_0004809173 /DNA_START=153 /DNA_END=2969 /DNA_ORIENTATION=+
MPCFNEIVESSSSVAEFSTWKGVQLDVPDSIELSNKSAKACVSAEDAMDHIETSLSDIRFDFTSNSTRSGVIPLVSSHSSGESILGALSGNATISIITPSISLPYIYPTLLQLVSEQKKCVLHTPTYNLSQNLLVTQNPFHNLSIVKDTGCAMIFSSSPQESHDMTIVAHLLAGVLSRPVIHSYNGVSSQQQYYKVQLQSKDKLRKMERNCSSSSAKELFEEFNEFNGLNSKQYSPFEFVGSLTATKLIVALNTSCQIIDELKDSLSNNPSFGLLLVRVYRPWDVQLFLNKIPSSIKEIFVHQSSNVFSDVAGSLYQSSRKRRISTHQFDSIVEIQNFSVSPRNSLAVELFDFEDESVTKLFGDKDFTLFQRNNVYRAHGSSKWTIMNGEQSIVPSEAHLICCDGISLKYNDTLSSLEQNGVVVIRQSEGTSINEISQNTKEILIEKQANLILISHSEQFENIIIGTLSGHCNLNYSVAASDISSWLDSIESNEVNLFPSNELTSLTNSSLISQNSKTKTQISQMDDDSRRIQLSWRFMFPESYKTESTLKPGSKGIHQVFLTKWVRLTPESYDRNVFHMEMDISNTDLSYDIGDALGVYGKNNEHDVNQFISRYGLDPTELISFYNSDTEQNYIRTLQQLLIQDVDLFGRPTKRFYANLAQFATELSQQNKLNDLGDSTGAEEFRARAAESVTIAEVLEEFSSVKLSGHELVTLVGPIKPRHYSIASSMNAHPDSVHLLVVDHTWVTPKGVLRRGQCTRYLQGLREGASLSVSVKPSVMKLPVDNETPIVMSGLGTGMAPFRAFIQERIFQAQQGEKIGEMVLYFGSRSSKQEYLYGEELEAYLATGMLTHMGLAFSRDQAHKVYIQHKISEDSDLLWELLHEKKGHFYLCGPTWPAGDVQTAISTIFAEQGNFSTQKADKQIQQMKSQERYVLEVY